MGIVSGAMSVARFRVEGALPDSWRDAVRDRLDGVRVPRPAAVAAQKEEVEGWVRVQNLLDTEFDDFNPGCSRHAVFALRVDKKVLPGKLSRPRRQGAARKWAAERGVERVPANGPQGDQGEAGDGVAREDALPVLGGHRAVAWHVDGAGWVVHGGASEKVVDRVRKRFHRTFGSSWCRGRRSTRSPTARSCAKRCCRERPTPSAAGR
jgi:hypothetical protein